MPEIHLISEQTARKIFSLLARQGGELDALVAEFQKTIPDQEEYFEARRFIGNLMGEMYDAGMRPIFNAYPALIPDAFK